MAKILKYDTDAKTAILNGVNALEKAVSVTLGPAGKNVIIDEYGTIHTTKDGVTVAKAVAIENPVENIGASALKQISEKSNSNCGDGTTSTVVLGADIYRNGLKYISLGGANATQVRNGIKKAVDKVVEYIKANAIQISSKEDIKKVALVSANFDEDIAETIAEVMFKLGKDGTIKVENGQTMDITSKIVDGMTIDNPYASPYMITNEDRQEAELIDPLVLIVNKKLANIQEMLPCLQSVTQTGKSLLIIADDFQEDILSTLIMNKLRGFNVLAVKSPSYGDSRKNILTDIAILTGGKVVSDDLGVRLEDATVGSGILGACKRVVANKDNTVIIGGAGNPEEIENRAAGIRVQIDATTESYDKEKLQERLAKLTSGIGIILCGGSTEAEAKERRDRVDDAFNASKSALKAGVVAGGGALLYSAKKVLVDLAKNEPMQDVRTGINIVLNSLEAPLRTILKNAEIDPGSILEKLDHAESSNVGYNVISKEICNMLEAGIYDSAEVVMNEIVNAGSVAGLLLTTDCVIVEKPADATPPSPSGCSGHCM